MIASVDGGRKKKGCIKLHELCLVMGCNCHNFYYIKLKDIMGELGGGV